MSYSSEVLADSPLRYWPLDETSGTNADDASPNSGDATYTNSPTLGVTGVIGTAMTTTAASTNYLSAPISGLTTAWSLEFWYKYGGTGTVIWRDQTVSGGWFLGLANSNADLTLRAGGTDRTITGAGTTLTGSGPRGDGWHHIVMTSSGTSIVTYIDKTAVDTWARTVNASTVATALRFGRNGNTSQYTSGTYDEIVVYSAVLASGRVTAHYDAAAPSVNVTAQPAPATAAAARADVVATADLSITTRAAAATAAITLAVVAATTSASVDPRPAAAVTATSAATIATTSNVDIAAAPARAVAAAALADVSTSSAQDLTVDANPASASTAAPRATIATTIQLDITARPAHSVTAAPRADVTSVTDLMVNASPAYALAAVPSADVFAGNPPIATQTWNRVGGRVRGGYAFIEWTPPVAAPPAGITLSDEADVPFAKAFVVDSIDADGNSVITDRQTVYGPMLTVRIVVGGKDVTFFRDVRTPVPDWQFTEPFGYGPAVFNFEVIGPHEVLGEFQGDTNASVHLRDWLYRDAPMKIQLVDHATQTVHSTIWRGQLEDTIENDNNLQVIASGLWSGEAATRWLPNPLFGENKDIGQLIWRLSESVAGVRMKPEGGPTTGLENPRLGEMTQLEAATTLLRRAQTRSKGPYTLTPVPWGGNVFRMVEKDTETIDATFYGEGKQLKLQRVRAGEADRIFGRGTTPGGQRVRNGRYPGVLDDPDEAIQAAPYPFADDRSFGLGTVDADTDTGDGISVLLVRMQTYGLLAREDVEAGTFNIAAEGGINRLRFRMELALTGLVTPNVWDALFNVGRIGSSVWWSKVEPMAQTNWSIRWNTSADGSILSHHDGHDGDRRIVDKAIDFGVWRREQMFDFADKDLDEEQTPNIFGEVEFGDHGGLLRGSVDPGTVVTDDDFMHQLELRPGMNIRFPYTRWGDIVLRFPTFAISGGSSPSVTGRGSTRPVDSLPLWETLNEAKAARVNTDKLWWRQNRSSSKVSDAVGEFEEYGGQINPVTVEGGVYRVVKVLAGQIGMFERFRIRTTPEREFVAAIFGLPIGVGKLASVCPDPLADKQGWIDSMDDLNDEHRLLGLWGEPGDPGGYSPGSKSAGHALTGVLDDRAGMPFKTSEPDKFRPWVYLVLFSANDTVFEGGDQGRILWNQELVGQ